MSGISARSIVRLLGATISVGLAAACGSREENLSDHPCYDPNYRSRYQPSDRPFRFPLVLQHVGSVHSSRAAIDDRLDTLRQAFEPAGIQIYLHQESDVPSGDDSPNQLTQGAINLFIVESGENRVTPFDPAITLSPESDPVDWVHAFARYFGLTYDREDEKIEMGVYDLQDPLNQDEKEALQCLLSEEVAPHLNPNLTEEERLRIESLTVGCDDDPETLGSIQEAVDQISWGGEIVVCRGGYFESLNIHGGSFTLAANISRPGTIDPVFINPIEGERALAISAGANVTVGNIGFAHGEADEGGVVRVQDSQLHLYDSQIGGGTAVRGGGLACFNSLCRLERREQAMFISVCEASEKGAAVFLSHSLFTTYETLMDEDLVEGGKGAGIYAERGSVIEGVNTHLFNMRAGRGTALYLEDSVAFLRGDSSISATFAMEESSGAVELVSGDGESTLMIEPPFSWNQFGTSRGRSIRNNPADVVIRGGGTYSGLSNNQVLFCSTESGVCE